MSRVYSALVRDLLKWELDAGRISDEEYRKELKRFKRHDRIKAGILLTLWVVFVLSMLYIK